MKRNFEYDRTCDESQYRQIITLEIFLSSIENGIESMEALKKFLSQAEQDEKNKEDIVIDFVNANENCEDFFSILDKTDNTREQVLLLKFFEIVITRICYKLRSHKATAAEITNKLLRNHSDIIFRMFKPGVNSYDQIVALKLLIAMVRISSITAKEVCLEIDWDSKHTMYLLRPKGVMKPLLIRSLFLNLLSTIMLKADVILYLLNYKDFIQSIFDRLFQDNAHTISLFLRALHKKVIKNTAVSQTIKKELFTFDVMKKLSIIYLWDGQQNRYFKITKDLLSKVQNKKPSTEFSSEQLLVYQALHNVLMTLCCSFEWGIVVSDKTVGTSGLNLNPHLTPLFKFLNKINRISLVEDLIFNILSTCPDQLACYLSTIEHLLEPRSTFQWLRNMDFLEKIFTAQKCPPSALNLFDYFPVSKIVTICLTTTVPLIMSRQFLIHCFRKDKILVRYQILKFIKFVLSRIKVIQQHCENESFQKTTGPEKVKQFMEEFATALIEVIPNVNSFIEFWTSISENSLRAPEKEKTDEDENLLQEITLKSFLLLMLQVLSEYQDAFPQVFKDVSINFQKFFSKVRNLTTDDNEAQIATFYLYIIKLMIVQGNQQSIWERENSESKSTMFYVMSLMIDTPNNNLKGVAQSLIAKSLYNTGFFDWNKEEIDMWLTFIRNSKKKHRAVLKKFLDVVFHNLVANPYHHLDTVAAHTAPNINFQISETAVKKDHIESTTDTENAEKNKAIEDCSDLIYKRFSFSILVPTVLETLKNFSEQPNDYLSKFVSTVLINVLYFQYDAKVLCLLLEKYKSLLTSDLQKLCSFWISGKEINPLELEMVQKNPESFSQLLTQIVLTDCKVDFKKNLKQLLKSVKNLSFENIIQAIRQVLFYLNVEIHKTNKEKSEMIENIHFHFEVLNKLVKSSAAGFSHSIIISDEHLTEEIENILSSTVKNETLTDRISSAILFHPFVVQFLHSKNNLSPEVESVCINLLVGILPLINDEETRNAFQKLLVIYNKEFALRILNEMENFQNIENSEEVEYFWNLVKLLLPYISANYCENILDSGLRLLVSLWQAKKTPLTPLIEVVCLNLQKLIKTEGHEQYSITAENFQNFLFLFKKSSLNIVEETLFNVLQKFYNIYGKNEDILFSCLTHVTPTKTRILEVLFQNKDMLTAFELWIHKTNVEKKVVNYIGVFSAYLQATQNFKYKSPIIEDIMNAFWPLILKSVNGTDEDCDIDDNAICLSRHLLDNYHFDISALEPLLDSLENKVKSCLSDQKTLQIYDAVLNKFIQINPKHGRCVAKFISNLLYYMQEKSVKSENLLIESQIISYSLKYVKHAKRNTLRKHLLKIWNQFIKYTLRTHFEDASALELISQLIPCIYLDETSREIIKPSLLYQMVIGHSSFTGLILDEDNTKEIAKESLITLMYSIVKMDHSCCNSKHLFFLLGAYNATLSLVDQKLLLLIQLYDSVVSFKNVNWAVWGSIAVAYYSIKKNTKPQNQENEFDNIINILDKEKLWMTTVKFPLHRKLIFEQETIDGTVSDVCEHIYDPCFLLSFFTHLLETGSFNNCLKFIECGALGLVLAALSSYDLQMRGASLYVLTLFYSHVSKYYFQQQKLILAFLNLLQQSLEDSSQRISCLITIFLAKVSRIIINAEDPMFSSINHFLWLRPVLDLTIIPEFYNFFKSAKYSNERNWLLQYLIEGLRDENDYILFKKQFIPRYLMGFFNCPLSDKHSKILIVKLLKVACSVEPVAKELVELSSLLIWVHAVIKQCCDDEIIDEIISLLSVCWKTLSKDGSSLADSHSVTFSTSVDFYMRQQLLLIKPSLPLQRWKHIFECNDVSL